MHRLQFLLRAPGKAAQPGSLPGGHWVWSRQWHSERSCACSWAAKGKGSYCHPPHKDFLLHLAEKKEITDLATKNCQDCSHWMCKCYSEECGQYLKWGQAVPSSPAMGGAQDQVQRVTSWGLISSCYQLVNKAFHTTLACGKEQTLKGWKSSSPLCLECASLSLCGGSMFAICTDRNKSAIKNPQLSLAVQSSAQNTDINKHNL